MRTTHNATRITVMRSDDWSVRRATRPRALLVRAPLFPIQARMPAPGPAAIGPT